MRRGARTFVPYRALLVAGATLVAAACAETQFLAQTAKEVQDRSAPAAAGTYKVGNPYQIGGVWYYPSVDYDYVETGIASWYGPKFHKRRTANGEVFDMNQLSAAHRTLPMPSVVRVTNLENGRSMKLRVNDRGPFAHGRIIDLSRRAAQLLGFERQGTAKVRVEIVADESRMMAANARGGRTLAADQRPIAVDRLPKAKVTAETLAPPPGGGAARGSGAPPARLAAAEPAPIGTAGREAPRLEQDANVTLKPVAPTRIFVQAGAFAEFTNADRLRARLSSLGPVRVTSALVDGRDLFRVRLGPLASVAEADRLLASLVGFGFPRSRIVVD